METKKPAAEVPPFTAAPGKAPDIAAATVPDTLTALNVDPDTGLTQAEVETRRKAHGYNEVAEAREHPVLRFLSKFWGLSASTCVRKSASRPPANASCFLKP
jgi:magnesium-transporting ATPase (P-type)